MWSIRNNYNRGAQAIGYLTYIEKVNKIIGPGSDFVTAAKRHVSGLVAKESMEAGPSEILVLADNKTNINQIEPVLFHKQSMVMKAKVYW